MEIGYSIPKKIHYCWLGKNEKPELVRRCIESWKKMAPDYEIIEWNENNFSFENCNKYVQQALNEKKWAFVTDYMRLYILYMEGGIYLDTDVEIKKNFDSFLFHKSFIGMESLTTVCTAVIGAQKSQFWIKELLDLYEKREFVNSNGKIDKTPNSQFIFNYLNDKFSIQSRNKKIECEDGLVIYPAEYFSPINYSNLKENITENTHAIHYYGGLWKSNREKFIDYLLAICTRLIGEERREYIKIKIKRIKGVRWKN